MANRSKGPKGFGPGFKLPMEYVPVETGWAVPANLPEGTGTSVSIVANTVAAAVVLRATAASPWNPDGLAVPGLDEVSVAKALTEAFSSVPSRTREQDVILLRHGPEGIKTSVHRGAAFRKEWTPSPGLAPAWHVARKVGEPVRIAFDEEWTFHREGGVRLEDPLGFMRSHAAMGSDGLHIMPGPLTAHLCEFGLSIMEAEQDADHVMLGHLNVLWKLTKPLAARHAPYAADHAAFEDAMSSPFALAMQAHETGNSCKVAVADAAARLERIVHTPAAEAYCTYAGIGLGQVATKGRDPEPAAWSDLANWLDAIAPGQKIGSGAFRTTLMLEIPEAADAAAGFEAWMPEPVAEGQSTDGMRIKLYEKGDLAFMTGELHPNFEISGWTREVLKPARLLH